VLPVSALHVSPVNDAVIRVTFGAGQKIKELFQNSQTKIKWQQKETREAILINTKEIQLTVDKKSGAISYANAAGKTVLKEKTAPPRQMDVVKKQNWMYFDWSRSERLSAKGVLKDDRLPLKNTFVMGKNPNVFHWCIPISAMELQWQRTAMYYAVTFRCMDHTFPQSIWSSSTTILSLERQKRM